MPRTTKRAERLALAKQRRKVRQKLKNKQRARYTHKKGLGQKKGTHPHRKSSALRNTAR
ncbi:MAG: hypothetical protein ACOCX4_02450 [Planctomycetota bacterium]